MPSHRHHNVGVAVRKYDVVGEDVMEPANSLFVSHVGLALDQGFVATSGEELNVAHMQPPHRSHGRMRVHSVGSVPLRVDEQNRIDMFVEDIKNEQKTARRFADTPGLPKNKKLRTLCQYVIRPHTDPVRERDGTIIHRRFSCAGYVIEAYREAGLKLLDTRKETLPPVEECVVKSAYPEYNDLELRPALASRGLEGTGPWHLVLPGYLLHALNRTEVDIRSFPYQAAAGDGVFPRI